MKKMLIIYRLFDSTYGPTGNPGTLSVYLREDNTLGYSHYSGWQDSGMGLAMSNLGLKRSLPTNSRQFKSTKKLHEEISSVLATGFGSNKIKTFEILNELKEKTSSTSSPTKTVNINGKKKKLSISIDGESLNIYVDNDTPKEQKEPTHVCYWHIDEVKEDAEVSISMINAVHLFHTNPQELINRLKSAGAKF